MTPSDNIFKHFLTKAISKVRRIRLIDTRDLYKYWEEESLRKFFFQYQPDCVFDVGANLGQYAAMLRQKVNYKGLLISFEPIPSAAAKLMELSKNDENWIVYDHAISTSDGEQEFNIMAASQFSSLSTPIYSDVKLFNEMNRATSTISVKTETLATALNRLREKHGFKHPFLKLDTQGWDTEIVRSSREAVSQFIGMQSELSIKKIYAHSMDFREAIALYESCGFTLSSFVQNNEGHFPILVETDCLMINNKLITSENHATRGSTDK
jgi:FkbM family methyltransferase